MKRLETPPPVCTGTGTIMADWMPLATSLPNRGRCGICGRTVPLMSDAQTIAPHGYGPPGTGDAREALRALVRDLDALISDSHGVAGLHLNGDLATWDWLTESEWLGSLAKARALASGAPEASPPGGGR
jgi:hypothetical protein